MSTYVFDQAWQRESTRTTWYMRVRCWNTSAARPVPDASGGRAPPRRLAWTTLRPRRLCGWWPAPRSLGAPEVEHLRPRLVGARFISEADADPFLRLPAQPEARQIPPFMVTAWGRRARRP
jgi:hypothetical protein